MNIPNLTNREREVCYLMMLGLNTKDAAKRLSLSPRTIEDTIRNAEVKFGVHSIGHLVYELWQLAE